MEIESQLIPQSKSMENTWKTVGNTQKSIYIYISVLSAGMVGLYLQNMGSLSQGSR